MSFLKRNRTRIIFSASEKRGIVLLSALVLLLTGFLFFINSTSQKIAIDTIAFQQDIKKWEEAQVLLEKQKERVKEQKKQFTQKRTLTPFSFDPNTVSAEEWITMGFSQKEAAMVVNFRNKGGKFYKKADVLKLYCVNEEDFNKLKDFIKIEAYTEKKGGDTILKKTNKSTPYKKKKYVPLIVEINSADSVTLLKLRGIGPVFARRIINYRTKLGGFVKKEQLMEVYGVDSLRYSKFASQILLDTTRVSKINLNSVGFKTMLKHPYFEYFMVKAIFDYKRSIGEYKQVEDLRQIKLIYEQLYQKIMPYVEV